MNGWIVLLFACLGVMLSRPGLAEDRSPNEVLREDSQLTPVGRPLVWICTAEVELQRLLADLPPQQESLQQLVAQINVQYQENATKWNECETLAEEIEAHLLAEDQTTRQIRRLRTQLREQRSHCIDPDLLGGEPEVRTLLIQLTNQRHALLLGLFRIRHLLAEMDTTYASLRESEEVLHALQALPRSNRLGPISETSDILSLVEQVESRVLSADVPLFQMSGQLRFGGLMNEVQPITFSWHASHEPTFITTSAAMAGGIEIDPEGATMRTSLGRRTFHVRAATLPSLRLGETVLHDVAVWVLPPEGEDIGSHLGVAALEEIDVRVDRAHFRLIVRPHE